MQTVVQSDRSIVLSDGARLAYTLHVPRPGAPPVRKGGRLVLIHSLALDRTVWDEVVAALGDEAEILTYDCRGHGRSDRRGSDPAGSPAHTPARWGAFTADSFARDLAELLDWVGWQKAAIVGCSMGGSVALAFAGLFPARTAALGLIDTTAWYGPDAAAQFRQRAEAARAKGLSGMIDFQLTRWFSDAFRSAHPDVLQRLSAVYVANDFDCYASSCALLGDADLRAHLPALRMPVGIVVGEEDYATPIEMARQLHAAITHSTLTVLPKARHLTPVERPDAIAEMLRGLLGKT